MPALPTPGQLNLRAELYQQIATFTASGIPVRKALETLRRAPPSRSFRQPLARLIPHLDNGLTFAEALRTENPGSRNSTSPSSTRANAVAASTPA